MYSTAATRKLSLDKLVERKLAPLLQDMSPEEREQTIVAFKRWRERALQASREYHTRWSMAYFVQLMEERPRQYQHLCMDADDWRALQRRWHQDIKEQLDTSQAIDISVKYRARWLPDFVSLLE